MFEFTSSIDANALHFEHRRWYDPTVGRWLSEDVVGFAECNVPCYVGNSPINAADPSQI
jgi:RHS repeat-associated protein